VRERRGSQRADVPPNVTPQRPGSSFHPLNGARSALPIVPHALVRLDPAERKRLDGLATRLLKAEPALSATTAFGPRVFVGVDDGPAVYLEDHTEIPLSHRQSELPYQYRALLLAGDGDCFLVDGAPNPAFEAYCRDRLALGRVTVLSIASHARDPGARLAQRCAEDPAAFASILALARRHGRMTIVPYIGTGSVWRLAGFVAEQAKVPVSVAAPPPRLTLRVNDKLWFAARVSEVLGDSAQPPTYHAFGPAALAGRVAALARRHQRVVIKVPESAGSAGNLVIESDSVRGVSLAKLRKRLMRLMRGLGWPGDFPLMVAVWVCPALASPSVQVWVPRRDAGLPVVEGVFDQIVEGPTGTFVGATASAVPDSWRARLTEDAVRLAYLFQGLGYFGRCSFDAVITGEDYATARLHWIECNGRWGGTSIPMTLANRLVGDWARRSLLVTQREGLGASSEDFASALVRLDEVLLRGGDDTGVVFLTPGGLAEGSEFVLLALAASPAEAEGLVDRVATLLADAPA